MFCTMCVHGTKTWWICRKCGEHNCGHIWTCKCGKKKDDLDKWNHKDKEARNHES